MACITAGEQGREKRQREKEKERQGADESDAGNTAAPKGSLAQVSGPEIEASTYASSRAAPPPVSMAVLQGEQDMGHSERRGAVNLRAKVTQSTSLA